MQQARLRASRPYLAIIGLVALMMGVGVVIPIALTDPPESAPAAAATPSDFAVPTTEEQDTTDDEEAATDADDADLGTDGAGTSDDPGAGAAPGAAAPQTADGPATTAPGAGGQAGAEQLTASDRGVTAEEIRLGIMLLDIGALSNLGIAVPGADPREQRQAWDAFIEDVNDRGGINGRRVVPFYRQFDLLNRDDQRAACLEATQDRQVFAVLDLALTDPAVLCVTQENRTPLIAMGGQGFSGELYRRSGGMLFSTFAAGPRMLENFAHQLHDFDALRGKRIGILNQESTGAAETVQSGLLDTLDRLGYRVTYQFDLAEDFQAASSQVPIAVQQMQARNIDVVLVLATVVPVTQFVQQADTQRFTPSYWVSDWKGGYTDIFVENMPASFDGRLITTQRTGEVRQDRPEPPVARDCIATFEARSGTRVDRTGLQYQTTVRMCELFWIFEQGASAAGAELTREGLSSGIQGLGEIPVGSMGGASYAPGKFDAADHVRMATFDAGCRCWVPTTEFRPPARQ